MWAVWILAVVAVLSFSSEQVKGGTFEVSYTNNTFLKDGKPFQYISGSIHYFRVPNQYWQDRLKKIRLLGFNTICTYVEWSFHEQKQGVYNFEGDADLVKFIQLAQQEGLNVILRPGPYICAEREFGGFPGWLLTENPNMRMRTSDPTYLYFVEKWLNVLYQRITPLLYGNGGPIITVQIENEYGFYPENDKTYLNWLRDITYSYVGENAVLFTTDTAWNKDTIHRGQIAETLTTVDFGTTNNPVSNMFNNLKPNQASGPLVNSEFYPGWISYWGKPLAKVSTDSVISTMTGLLQNHVNFNVYMIFGGTNFGFSAGSDFCLTSYDYDAPISEAGDLTDKYMAIRALLEKQGWPVGSLEEVNRIKTSPKGTYGKVQLNPVVSLLKSTVGSKPVQTKYPMNMEAYGQSYGLIAYTHILDKDSQDPSFLDMHSRDRSTVIVDDKVIAQLEYGKIDTTPLPPTAKKGSQLTILVENVGRRTFGGMYDVTRGIISNVSIDGQITENWVATSYNLETSDIQAVQVFAQGQSDSNATIPAFYTSSFGVPPPTTGLAPVPDDTFLDMTGWGKGYVWVNGHNLGRYWHVGPQMTLYVPGVWLNPYPQTNTITILELQYASPTLNVEFIANPIFTY